MLDGRPPVLWGVVEYRFKGNVWGPRPGEDGIDPLTLDRWLETHGVRFSGGGARGAVIAGGADSKLARYAAKKAYLDLAEFPRPVNSMTLSPAGDPRDRVIELLLDPGAGRGRLGRVPGRRAGAGRRHLWHRVGRGRPARVGTPARPAHRPRRGLGRDRARRRLPVCGAHSGSGQGQAGRARLRAPGDAASSRRDRSSPEPGRPAGGCDLGALVDWADRAGRGSPRRSPASSTGGLPGSSLPWRRPGPAARLPRWRPSQGRCRPVSRRRRIDGRLEIMEQVKRLADAITGAQAALLGANDAGTMAATYGRDAWVVDAAWLRIAEASRELAELAPIRRLAARLYAAYADKVNQRFTDLVEQAAVWPPTQLPQITDDADALWERPQKAKGRRAVIVVDAFRMDVARALQERLGPAAEIQVRATILPTTTPFGMTAALAGRPAGDRDHRREAVRHLAIDGHDGLETRDGRKAYLTHVITERGDTVAFVELEQVLQGDTIPDARFVVLFTYALDDQGHSAADTASLPEEAAKLPGPTGPGHRATPCRGDLAGGRRDGPRVPVDGPRGRRRAAASVGPGRPGREQEPAVHDPGARGHDDRRGQASAAVQRVRGGRVPARGADVHQGLLVPPRRVVAPRVDHPARRSRALRRRRVGLEPRST